MSKSNCAVAEVVGAYLATSGSDADLWYRVARGELSADDAMADLLAGRAEVGILDLEQLERAKKVFAPPSDERRGAVLEALLTSLSETRDRATTSQPSTSGSSSSEHVLAHLRPRRRQRWVIGLCAVAAAAVLTVLLVRPPEARGSFPGGYELELEHVTTTIRGSEEPTGTPMFSTSGKIGLRLVPDEAIAGPIGAVVFATGQQGRTQILNVDPTVHTNGVVEFVTTVRELGLREGEWQLVVVIGWADALPDFWETMPAVQKTNTVQILKTRILVTGH
ncbi:MAG: hypothetical protein AB1Z98_37280 [Nannocystaceae bacterium]